MNVKAVNILNMELSTLQERINNKKEIVQGFKSEIEKEESLIAETQTQVDDIQDALGKLQ